MRTPAHSGKVWILLQWEYLDAIRNGRQVNLIVQKETFVPQKAFTF